MNLGQLIETLELIREERGDLIQVVLRTKDIETEVRTWTHDFVIAIWEDEGYLDEISIQNFI